MTHVLTIYCALFTLAAPPGTTEGELFVNEKAQLKRELQRVELSIKSEAEAHKAACGKAEAEAAQKQQRLHDINSENSTLETSLTLLKERETFAAAGAGEDTLVRGFNKIVPKEAEKWPIMARLQAAWAGALAAREITIRTADYFAPGGEKKAGNIYQIGRITAIATENPPLPLINTGSVWQAQMPEEALNPPFYPLAQKSAGPAKDAGFISYMRAGGVLSWPIFALGIFTLLIFLERLTAFARRNRGSSGQSGRRFIKTLTLIATAAPLMGLLGTILGIMATFDVLGQSTGSADPAALSQGISEALITTELGLIVALLALFSHHVVSALANRRAPESEQNDAAA